MDINSLKTQPADLLLRLFAETLEELRRRGLVRSSNNPVADYAEKVAAYALGLRLVGKSGAGHDGEDTDGRRYQIKGRRVPPHNVSRQLSFMRNMDARPFDYLVGTFSTRSSASIAPASCLSMLFRPARRSQSTSTPIVCCCAMRSGRCRACAT